MKLSRYYPFERNRFFYGKLLTVRDFETEQKYFNDKRRMVNRLLHGIGVVSGLHVVAIDDRSISVEMGMALDHLGREIIIANPVTLKLSTIEGFTNNEYAKNVYLCLAYDEKGKEPVHSVANSSTRSEEVSEYNRILETYKLYIKEEAPDPSAFEISQLLENTTIIYQDAQVRILQTTPRYVNPDEVFEVVLTVEKTLQTPTIFFEFELDSEQFERFDETHDTKVSFSEPNNSQTTEYKMSYYMKSKSDTITNAEIGFKTDSAKLSFGDHHISIDSKMSNNISIISGSVDDKIIDDYYERTLDQSVSSPSDPCIYLAKISLMQSGPTYMIEKVDHMPFNEYIYNSSVIHRLKHAKGSGEQKNNLMHPYSIQTQVNQLEPDAEPEFKVNYYKELNEFDFFLGLPKSKEMKKNVTSGTVEIVLKHRGVFSKSKRFVSNEIEHGLGFGPVCIEASVEETDDEIINQNKQLFFGDADVFADSRHQSSVGNVTIGCVVYPNQGTFRVGIKLNGAVSASTVTVRWWAFKELDELEQKLDKDETVNRKDEIDLDQNDINIEENPYMEIAPTKDQNLDDKEAKQRELIEKLTKKE